MANKVNYRAFPRHFVATGLDFVNPSTGVVTEDLITSSGKVGTNSVITASITDSAVTTAKILDSNVTVAKLADNIIHEETVSLTAANIQAMYTTAVDVLAAPGAGKAIVVDEFELFTDAGATAMADGGDVTLNYTDKTGDACTGTIAATVVNSATDAHYIAKGVGVAPVANAKVVITNATQAFATGNSTYKVRVRYHIVTLLS